ncbi:Na+/H+ antiporter subunit E, partial [Anaeromicrobium sediminis]
MKKMKQNFKLFLIQFLFWMFLTLDFTPLNFIIGIVFSSIVTKASYGVLYDNNGYKFDFPRISTFINYILKLIVEIYKSSFSYILRIIKKDCEPIIVEVDLEVKDPLIITIIS